MSVTQVEDVLVSILPLAAVYALVTLGYVVVFRATKVFNFMHPEFMLIGALLFTTAQRPGAPGFALGLVVAILVTSIVGLLLYWLVMHRCAGYPHWIQMILTLGMSIVALNVAQLLWGTGIRYIDLPVPRTAWRLPGGATLTSNDVGVVVAGVALSAGLAWLLTGSRLGVRMRAAAEDPLLTAFSGLNVGWLFATAWVIAAAAAVVAGVMYSVQVPLSPGLVDVGLLAFPAAMIGGMDSISGAFAGSVILAALDQVATRLWSSDAATAISFAAVLFILVLRPQGLLGTRALQRI
jgi:branched-chain amino acid transport system permease protein